MVSPAWVTDYTMKNELPIERHPVDLARENLRLQFEIAERQRLEERLRAEIAHLEHIFAEEKTRLILELEQARAQAQTLSGLLSICSSCKKIRDDNGNWQQIEVYIRQYFNVDFSHGICPDCARRYYPGYNLYEPEGI